MGLTQKLGTIPLAIQTDSSNNVGIGGTPSGSFKFEAIGGTRLASSGATILTINSTNANGSANVYQQSGTNIGWIGNGSSSLIGGSTNDFTINGQTNINLAIGGFSRVIVNSSGNVGIGMTNPSVKLNVWGGEIRWGFTSDLGALSFTDNKPMLASLGATDFLFYTNAAERMRITGTGSVQINGPTLSAGDPSTYALRVGQSGGVNLSLSWNSSAGYIQTFASTPLYLNQQGNAVFANGSAGFGQVTTTSSDIRIKKNITSIELALDKVNALRGVYYEFDENNELAISVPNGKTRVGLIAQEVETIIPEAVLDGDNENIPKSVDYTGLVGLLVKAIQELSAKVTALENK